MQSNYFSISCALSFVISFICCFFQAEDGIRYYKVTGVQTCALPIWKISHPVGDLGIVGRHAKDPDRTLVGCDAVEDHADRGRLSRPVGPEQAIDRTLWHAQSEIANGYVRSVALRDVLDLDCLLSHIVSTRVEPYNINVEHHSCRSSRSLRPRFALS